MIPTEIDTRLYRDALGMFPTGVAVLTTWAPDGTYAGLTVSSFNSVSLDPPLIVWSLSLVAQTAAAFRTCSHYAVNVLAEDQVDISCRFALTLTDKFAGLEVTQGLGGAPLLAGCSAWFECRNETQHAGGDHIVMIGHVERFSRTDRSPLVFQGGHYRAIGAVLGG